VPLQGILGDARYRSWSVALVGMGTFYGGSRMCRLSSLRDGLRACRKPTDLLVPLMLARGIAFVALRRRSSITPRCQPSESPRPCTTSFCTLSTESTSRSPFARINYVAFREATPGPRFCRRLSTDWQLIFPVLDGASKICGTINAEVLRTLRNGAGGRGYHGRRRLHGAPFSFVKVTNLHAAIELMVRHHLRELVVTDDLGKIVGFMDEATLLERIWKSSVPRNTPNTTGHRFSLPDRSS